MAFCWYNRRVPILRARGLPLSYSAIALLHVYWILGQITYPIGATMPTILAYDIQYFGMGIYFPLGIALFHASNLRFLHVAKISDTSWLCRLLNMDYMKRAFLFIRIGIVFQFILSVCMWLACAKYHPTFGIHGMELHSTTVLEQIIELGRGWEWRPSMLWLVIWTWIAAPMLIWEAWDIHDTMRWRTQTVACCISRIHLSIMMFEIFTVFVPIFEVVKLWMINKKTTNSMTKFHSTSSSTLFQRAVSVGTKNISSSTLAEKGQVIEVMDESTSERLYTMDALEQTLSTNANELQEFAALSDFSGENIAFMSEIAKWKSSWPESLDFNDERQTIGAFNLGATHLRGLYQYTRCGVPTEYLLAEPQEHGTNYTGDIPAVFDMTIFDAIRVHVKYLVLTNTWPKFVESMRRRSIDSQDTEFSAASGTPLLSWIPEKRAKLK
ncbi:G-protein coupled receptor protein [Aspergillus affinis]|uniref:G-protein coupled receptor protein n=1 Tax=Aspergillus affinis TaxID=1070780 RepID=UPI0022FEDA7D|nr:G-protein coupled receptor protein [Aspergillus affinis]KAI9035244.1 G-protein coupled receptor protein [Aspergillus affinis]